VQAYAAQGKARDNTWAAQNGEKGDAKVAEFDDVAKSLCIGISDPLNVYLGQGVRTVTEYLKLLCDFNILGESGLHLGETGQ